MPDPSVVCVMLTANRPEMARQAVECFRRQTYEKKKLLEFDTSWRKQLGKPATIGELRNQVNALADADILCHWDDDDYSAPRRIEEQIALLQASGAQAVGYNSMLFYREAEQTKQDAAELRAGLTPPKQQGEAWLYTGSILGTSLMYKREAWERKHFEAMNNGEDTRWLMGMKAVTESSLYGTQGWAASAAAAMKQGRISSISNPFNCEPRMIARIHSGNTSNAYRADVMRAVEKQGGEWKRVSAWDDVCRKVFA